jgi:hypothetical protein
MTVTRMEGAHGRPVSHRTDDLEVRRDPVRARALTAAGLSLLWPGLGHAYLGRTAPAVAFVIAQVLVVVLSVMPGFWRVTAPVWVLLVLSSAVNSAWTARRDHRASVD